MRLESESGGRKNLEEELENLVKHRIRRDARVPSDAETKYMTTPTAFSSRACVRVCSRDSPIHSFLLRHIHRNDAARQGRRPLFSQSLALNCLRARVLKLKVAHVHAIVQLGALLSLSDGFCRPARNSRPIDEKRGCANRRTLQSTTPTVK